MSTVDQLVQTDPVMNIRFPRAFAAGKKEYQGRTYHFYTKESMQEFETAPFDYIKAEQPNTDDVAQPAI
jgi:YHS domain-containing protein